MGVIKRGILGGVSGSVGSVVGTSWKGIAVLKSKPLSVANPRTTAQVSQRDKMTVLVALCKLLLAEVIKPLWDRFAQQMSGYNMFVSQNIAYVDDGLAESLDWENFKIAQGKMLKTNFTLPPVSNSDDVVGFVFPTTTAQNQLPSDIAYAVVMVDNTTNVFVNSGNIRSSGSIDVSIPDGVGTGEVLHCYLAFKSADGRLVSTSEYQTITVIA
jgi:hypothetical protein